MEYDSIKDRISRRLDSNPKLLPLLYAVLNLLFLRTWYVHQALKRIHLDAGSKVLDAGTGFGQYAWYVIQKYPEVHVTGTDLKKEYLARAARCFKSYRLADRISLAVDDVTNSNVTNTFDCILAVDILEHIEEDEVAIRHFAKRLKPKGHLIISTPSDQGGSDVHSSDQESFIGEHVRDGYNLQELTQKLSSAGLEIVEAKYSYGTWGSLAWRLLIKIPIRLLGTSFFLMPLVVLYYVPVLPVGLLLNFLDLHQTNSSGTGLIVVAQKVRESREKS